MHEKMNYILTAPIQTGKTTSLISWSSEKNDVHGILTPVVNGKRVFLNANTSELFPMEADGYEETIAVGRFLFSKKNFEKAALIIRDAITKSGWLVIDEIGPLELRGEGFYTALNEVLKTRKEKIILVVREGLAEKVKEHFKIDSAEIIKKIAWIRS